MNKKMIQPYLDLVDISLIKKISCSSGFIFIYMIAFAIMGLIDSLMLGYVDKKYLEAHAFSFVILVLFECFPLAIADIWQTKFTQSIDNLKKTHRNFVYFGIYSFSIGLIWTAFCYLIAPLILSLFNLDEEMHRLILQYMNIRIIAIIFIFLLTLIESYWEASLQPKFNVAFLVGLNILNGIFNYIFIFGKFGFPEMTIKGAGLGSLLSILTISVLFLIYTLRKIDFSWVILKSLNIDWFGYIKIFKMHMINFVEYFSSYFVFPIFLYVIQRKHSEMVAISDILFQFIFILDTFLGSCGIVCQTLIVNHTGNKRYFGNKIFVNVFVMTTILSLCVYLLLLFSSNFVVLDEIENKKELFMHIVVIMISLAPIFSIGTIFSSLMLGLEQPEKILFISLITNYLLFIPILFIVAFIFDCSIVSYWYVMMFNWVLFGIMGLLAWNFLIFKKQKN